MWEMVANHPINKGLERPMEALNPDNGEVWQYMGSFRQASRMIHEFRHRSHPIDGERHLYKFDANETTSEDIDKILPVK
jgi:hypothetical protein